MLLYVPPSDGDCRGIGFRLAQRLYKVSLEFQQIGLLNLRSHFSEDINRITHNY